MYPETKGTVEAPNYVTFEQMRNEMRYYEEENRRIKMKIRLLVRILVDKKIIGEELAKTFEESNPSEVLSWFMKQHKEK